MFEILEVIIQVCNKTKMFIDALSKGGIILDLKAKDKCEILEILIRHGINTGFVLDEAKYREAVIAREENMTTGIGGGVAIPHGITDAVSELFLIVGVSPQGVDYSSIDSKPVFVFFHIGSPPENDRNYLLILAGLSRIFRQDVNRKKLLELKSEETLREFLLQQWSLLK